MRSKKKKNQKKEMITMKNENYQNSPNLRMAMVLTIKITAMVVHQENAMIGVKLAELLDLRLLHSLHFWCTRENAKLRVLIKKERGGRITFEERVKQLKTFKDENGHLLIRLSDGDKSLQNFIRLLRKQGSRHWMSWDFRGMQIIIPIPIRLRVRVQVQVRVQV